MYVGQSNMTILYVTILTAERPTRLEVLVQLFCIDASWCNIGNGLGVSYNFFKVWQNPTGQIKQNLIKLSKIGRT